MGTDAESAFLLDEGDREFFERFLAEEGSPYEGPGDVSGIQEAASEDRPSASDRVPLGSEACLYTDDIRSLKLGSRITKSLLKADIGYAGAASRVRHHDLPRMAADSVREIRKALIKRAHVLTAIGYSGMQLFYYLSIPSRYDVYTFDPLGFARPLVSAYGSRWRYQCEAVHLVSRWVRGNSERLGELYSKLVDPAQSVSSLGIGKATVEKLHDAGIDTVFELSRSAKEDLAGIKGIGAPTAGALIEDAKTFLRDNRLGHLSNMRMFEESSILGALLSLFDDRVKELAYSAYYEQWVYGDFAPETPFLLWALPMAEELLRDNEYDEARRLLDSALGWFKLEGIEDPAGRPQSCSPEISGPIDLEEWVCGDYLLPTSRACLSRRLNGESIRSIGRRYGLSYERVRQLVKNVLEERPQIKQDAYLRLLSQYGFSESDFIDATEESPRTIAYLRLVDSFGFAREQEPTIDEDIQRRIDAYLSASSVSLD